MEAAQAQQRFGDLDTLEEITPDYVRNLTEPTEQFLCRLSDNWPKVTFKGFSIRDMISNITLVDVA